jgi:hypothetical protein
MTYDDGYNVTILGVPANIQPVIVPTVSTATWSYNNNSWYGSLAASSIDPSKTYYVEAQGYRRQQLDIRHHTGGPSEVFTLVPIETGLLYVGSHKILPYLNLEFTPKLVSISTSTATISLTNNYIYTAGTLSSLTITLPSVVSTGFTSQINFVSGSTPTTLSASSDIYWTGDNISDVAPVLRSNCEYTILFYYEGSVYVGLVFGNPGITTVATDGFSRSQANDLTYDENTGTYN